MGFANKENKYIPEKKSRQRGPISWDEASNITPEVFIPTVWSDEVIRSVTYDLQSLNGLATISGGTTSIEEHLRHARESRQSIRGLSMQQPWVVGEPEQETSI